MGLTLLLIIICIFAGIRITVACSVHICKQATKIVSKELLQTHINIFSKKTALVSMRKLQKITLPLISQKWSDVGQVGNCKQFLCPFSVCLSVFLRP